MWIIPEPATVEEALTELKKEIPNIDNYLCDGSFEFIRQEDWFIHEGKLDLHKIIERVEEKLAGALAAGYAGMRLNGTTAWLQRQQWREFHAFETALDEAITNHRLIVLCTFPLNQTGAAAFSIRPARICSLVRCEPGGGRSSVSGVKDCQARNENFQCRVSGRCQTRCPKSHKAANCATGQTNAADAA